MPLRCIIRFFGWLWPRENYSLLLWHKLLSIQLKGINGPKTHSWSVKTQKSLMPLFQSKTKIIIPFNTIYLLRIEKIGIPLFLLNWRYNPFFQRQKFLHLLLFHFSSSAPDRLVSSHSRPTWPNPTPTCFLPAFKARSGRAFLAEFNYTNFGHIHHESFVGRSQNTLKIGKIEVKLGNLEMRYNSTEFSNKLVLALFSGGQIYE